MKTHIKTQSTLQIQDQNRASYSQHENSMKLASLVCGLDMMKTLNATQVMRGDINISIAPLGQLPRTSWMSTPMLRPPLHQVRLPLLHQRAPSFAPSYMSISSNSNLRSRADWAQGCFLQLAGLACPFGQKTIRKGFAFCVHDNDPG